MKVFAVFKTHFDIGFTDLSANIMKYICTDMLDGVLEVCEGTAERPEGKRYVWTMPSLPLEYMLDSGNVSPEKLKRLERLIDAGQVAWHAMPFTVHSDFSGLGELVYGLGISKRLSDRFSRPCVSAKMTDVPGHAWYLPTLLSAAGVKFLHLGCNPGSTPPDLPPLFWWEGPDGSRLLTMYMRGGYGSDVTPPEDWRLPVWLAMTMTNDNVGAHNIDIIDEMEMQLHKSHPDAEMFCGTLDDFYNAVLPYTADLPVIRKDLADTWIHGVGTYPREVSAVRNVRRGIASVNDMYYTLCAAGAADALPEFKERTEALMANLLNFDEHTWGCDVKLFLSERNYEKSAFEKQLSEGKADFAESSWNEQRERADRAALELSECEKLLKEAFNGSQDVLTAYNDGGGMGDYWIPVENGACYQDRLLGMSMTTYSGVNGDELYIPLMHNGEMRCFKRTIGRTVLQHNVTVRRGGGKAEVCTPYHSAVFSENDGTLLQLTDCKTGHCWITGGKPFYRYEIFSHDDIDSFENDYIFHYYDWIVKDLGKEHYPANQPHRIFYPDFAGLEVRENGESAEISLRFTADAESIEKYGNAQEIRIKFIFYGYKPEINLECELINKQASPFMEAGYFILPLAGKDASFCFDKTGSVIHPAEDIARCCNTTLYCAESFVHAQDGNCGITVITDDAPLFSTGTPGVLKFRADYEQPDDNTVYFNLFNNQWGTNFPQWTSGSSKFRFNLLTHKGDEAFGIGLARRCAKKPYVISGGISGEMKRKPLVLPDAVKILALNKTDSGFLLALRECSGVEADAQLDFSAYSEVYSCDLLSRCKKQLEKNRTEHFTPWSIHCYLIRE